MSEAGQRGSLSEVVCYAQIGIDCCNQPIIPTRAKLSMHTNRHTSTSGNSWGWVDGCSLNICWSNDDEKFNRKKAAELVALHNNVMSQPAKGSENQSEPGPGLAR